MDKQISIPTVSLTNNLSKDIPTPKFRLGQYVRWQYVPSQDRGRIVGVIYSAEASVQAEGYHYAIALNSTSPSYGDGITSDWAFEEDIELYILSGDREGTTE